MAFDRTYLSQVHIGGAGANSLWFYNDANSDNVGSLAGLTINAAYFSRAYDDHGIIARAGDVMIIFSQASTNNASPVMAAIPDDWDTNGASVIVTGSSLLFTHP